MRYLYPITLRFIREEDGPAAVEYAVLLALIVMVCIGSLNTLGLKVGDTFSKVSSHLHVGS